MMRRLGAGLVCFSLLAACGGDEAARPSSTAGEVVRPVGGKPAAPASNDPSYAVTGARSWYLVGNDLTPGHDALDLAIVAPAGASTVDAWLDDQKGVRLVAADGKHTLALDIAALPPGPHELLIAADGSATAAVRLTFTRSHPLYVLVSTDWDDADNSDTVLARQEELHASHAELRLTHFVGPYTFTDPTVTAERAQQLTDWVTRMRDDFRDEVGVHIHPYCNFVSTTGVTCRTTPSLAYPDGDETGYTVVVASYTEAEMTALLAVAAALFEARGLGRPTSFRAGGWSAEIHTIRALAAAGYTVDSSACNWARLEEWDGSPPGAILYDWNKEHWATIGDKSQPYYPSDGDILSSAAPNVPVLEVPDNGLLVDYVSSQEMIDVFNGLFTGGALLAPTMYQIGYHPPNFAKSYKVRIDEALTHVDLHRSSADAGPVVYATLSEMTAVWKAP